MRASLIVTMLLVLWTAAATAGAESLERAGWLLDRTEEQTPTLQRATLPQGDIGGTRLAPSPADGDDGGDGSLRPVLYSLLVPGLGEASLGYKRGYAMMALDVASWIGVKSYHDQGNQKRQDYYDYLDAHWTEARLEAAFGDNDELAGTFFYDVNDYTDLSLWVSREADEREYYENAGKWDQFVFGWDDFSDPRAWPVNWWQQTDPTWDDYTDLNTRILKDVRVSAHREAYRALRQDSNEAFDRRDTLVYLNMFTRVFSMVQVAYLQGVFTGGRSTAMNVAGHELALIAEPRGLTSSRLGVSISY